jgi:hypothetical protein
MQNVKLDVMSKGSSSVGHLELRNCNLDWRPIARLIGTASALNTFIMHENGESAPDLPHVLQALELHAASLRNLQLTFDNGEYDAYVPAPRSGLNFAAFSALEHLKITVSLSIGDHEPMDLSSRKEEYARTPQRLPGSLRRLTLTTMSFETLGRSQVTLLTHVLGRIM